VKRTAAAIAIAGLLLALVPPTASLGGQATEFKGSTCLDITNGAGTLTGTSTGSPVVSFDVTYASPTCKNSDYTLTAWDNFDRSTVVGSETRSGDGTSTVLTFTFPVTDTDGTVCVFGTTAKNGKPADRAPDASCLDLVDGSGSSGGQGFH